MKTEHHSTAKVISSYRIRVFRKNMLRWFDQNKRDFPWRKPGQSSYQVIVSEILLQQTRADTVARIYQKFFTAYPSWESLAQTPIDELAELIKPLGLWRRRSNVLINLAKYIEQKESLIPSSRAKIEDLPGVGQYIANAVELVLLGKPRPLLDVNMSRIVERYFGPRILADIRYDPYLQSLTKRIVNTDHSLELNWAILDLGALVCIVYNPKCLQCPLCRSCKHFRGDFES